MAERTASRNDQDTCSRGGQSYLFTLVNFSGPSSTFPCDRKEEGSALGNIDLALIHQHIPLLPRHDLHVKQCPLQPPAQSYSDLRKEISIQKRRASAKCTCVNVCNNNKHGNVVKIFSSRQFEYAHPPNIVAGNHPDRETRI
jgi:hypothetical protein